MYRRLIALGLIIISVFYLSFNLDSIKLEETKKISVEIRGKVENPGVYELPLGSTVQDILKLAKPDKDANLDVLSYQNVLYNKQILVIEQKSEKKLISINCATLEELSSLPGIGPSTAAKIIEYREKIGSFQTLEDLMKVKGIGNGKFNKLKEYICL
jgi:competence protein ComEA